MQEIFVVTFKFPHRNIPLHFSKKELAEEFLKKFYLFGNDKYIIDFDKLDMSIEKHNLYSSMEDVQKSITEQLLNVDAIEEMKERLDKFYKKGDSKTKF